MAFGKAVIVMGERAFSEVFTPETASHFHYTGMYGLGDGCVDNKRLIGQIRALAARREQLRAMGEFSRQFIERYYSVECVKSWYVSTPRP
jgi:hypothetical protein